VSPAAHGGVGGATNISGKDLPAQLAAPGSARELPGSFDVRIATCRPP